MELYKELLVNILSREKINISFPELDIDVARIVELESYKALNKIKTIIEDDSVDDDECFAKIDAIVHTFF